MEVSLVRTSLVNEPGNCGDIIPIVYELTKRTHEKHVRRLGTIIQSIFCAQSGASIHLTVWKWSGESRYPGALPPVFENFRRAFSPGPTDCPWVSEDEERAVKFLFSLFFSLFSPCSLIFSAVSPSSLIFHLSSG